MQADATAWAGPPQSPHETVPVATLMEGLEKAPAAESAGASAEAAAGAATLLQGLTAQYEELVAPTPATNGGSGVGDVNKDKALKRPRTACEECHVRKLRCDLTECACAGHQWLEPQTISDRRQRIGSRVLSCAAQYRGHAVHAVPREGARVHAARREEARPPAGRHEQGDRRQARAGPRPASRRRRARFAADAQGQRAGAAGGAPPPPPEAKTGPLTPGSATPSTPPSTSSTGTLATFSSTPPLLHRARARWRICSCSREPAGTPQLEAHTSLYSVTVRY
jgi:hypothetical protein